MPTNCDGLISVSWVLAQGANQHDPPSDTVFDAVVERTGFDIRHQFSGLDRSYISASMRYFSEFTFLRTPEEVAAIANYCPYGTISPFGVCYNFSKQTRKRKYVDWFIEVYGVCFAGKFANPERIIVWCDHSIVHGWDNINLFFNHWEKG